MEKIKLVQTKDRIAGMLRREILSGRMKGGEELIQEHLAEKLGVSRMPIREALQTLELEGLLLRLPNRHMLIIGLTADIIRQNLRVIAVVEAEIAIMLAQSGKDISTLVLGDEYLFHFSLSSLVGNHYINQIHKRLLDGYPKYIWQNITNRAETISLHKAILTAIQSSDEVAVFETVRRYYSLLADTLIASMKESELNEPPATH